VAGLPDAGPVTGWALPLLRLGVDAAAVGTVGLLLTGSVLVGTSTADLGSVAARTVRAAWTWSAAWCLCALAVLVLTVSETVGVPVWQLPLDTMLEQATTSRGRALLAVAALSGVVTVGAARVRGPGAARRVLALSLVGVLPTTWSGHAASTADHALAASALGVHVVAATVWLGGLLAVLLIGHRHPQVLGRAVPRFSAVALAAFACVGLSGAVSAWARLGTSADAWTSGYGALLTAKVIALVLLGGAGWRHRSHLVPGLVAGRPRAFLAFAGGELAVMGAAMGLAVALSRTPTPTVAARSVPT
jgi:putative copper resistance protein D